MLVGVGELALITSYLGWLSFLPRMVGRVLARRRQAGVAFERMRFLVADDKVDNAVAPRSLPVGLGDRRNRPDTARPDRVPLERLEVVGLGARYANGAGLEGVTFTIERGSFTVITGPIGSGKTTLLRTLLGLNARVESATIGGKTVYRVRMGPYGTASELATAKDKLANGGLPALAIKVK